jgi:hypothetical protein
MALAEIFNCPADDRDPRGGQGAEEAGMDPRIYCAYNQTRECFLGLEVAAADIPFPLLAEKMRSSILRSGEGLWIVPFRGLPITEVLAPLDLFYLDTEGRVLETVESFPTFRIGTTCPRPASVLALPAHSIYSSQTQPGDQLVVCVAEEMEQRLAGAAPAATPAQLQWAVLLRAEPLWSGGPGTVELETSTVTSDGHEQRHEMDLADPRTKTLLPPNIWLDRWWSPHPRKAPRKPSAGPAAYYWNGVPTAAHGIRDIGSSGTYLVTEEKWYPGTLVLMMLQRKDARQDTEEHTVEVETRAVRWGHDGIGVQFMLPGPNNRRRGSMPNLEPGSRKEFNRFLQLLRKQK